MVELIVSFTILSILTTMSVPLIRFRVRTERERELRFVLREMRSAIDKFKDVCDGGQIQKKLGTDCYPETLDQLVEGVKIANDPSGKKIRFLRRIPMDPFTRQRDWGLRSDQDDPASNSWGGQNVFDVYSKTFEKAPSGEAYSEW